MLAYETENQRKAHTDLPSNELPALPESSLTPLDTLALAEHLHVTLSEKDKLLHTKPTFLYPKDGLYGLL